MSSPPLERTVLFVPKQSDSSVLRNLGVGLPAVPHVRLRDPEVGDASDENDATGHRYELREELARGGMGSILRGHDNDLNRDIAIKVLLEEHLENPTMLRRFVEEAQIGGQLQHPGVVPVYELGQFPDRRLYFTMKLVKGRTLESLLGERDAPSSGLSRYLTIFHQVCQTMAYAHARGVIHRDLKPANVMVGAFGEVQVMDWGLAKVLPTSPAPPSTSPPTTATIPTVRSVIAADDDPLEPGRSATQAGTIMGTPAYMPPEQALGQVDDLDERCDVFGLGAILCEILTGQPPHVGRDATDTFHRASQADLTDAEARLAACGADPDLVALARRCLASDPAERPRDAGVVTLELTSYFQGVQDRLRAAELARAAAQAAASVERHRWHLALAIAAAIVAVVVLANAAAWWWLLR